MGHNLKKGRNFMLKGKKAFTSRPLFMKNQEQMFSNFFTFATTIQGLYFQKMKEMPKH